MKIGEKVNTSLGQILVLDVQKDYLILFDNLNNRFVKANNWQEDYEKVFWNGGEYYDSLNELIDSLNKDEKNIEKLNEDLYEIAMKKGEEAEKLRNSDCEREREAERKYNN